MNETRFTMLKQSHPQAADAFLAEAQQQIHARWKLYESWFAPPPIAPLKQESAP